MNIYFVFEGKTERLVYRHWLKTLLPHYTEKTDIRAMTNHNYMQRGDVGLPYLYQITADIIQKINENPVFDYLVLVLDADEQTVGEREAKARDRIAKVLENLPFETLPHNCRFEIIVQQVCLETWFLGNTNLVAATNGFETEDLTKYKTHFDTTLENPELMPLLESSRYSTNALFHAGYIREISSALKQKAYRNNDFDATKNLSYDKGKPFLITKNDAFLSDLQTRITAQPTHLKTFQAFLAFCESVQ